MVVQGVSQGMQRWMYATAFESVDALDKLANFASRFGADYYRLPYNTGEVVFKTFLVFTGHSSFWRYNNTSVSYGIGYAGLEVQGVEG